MDSVTIRGLDRDTTFGNPTKARYGDIDIDYDAMCEDRKPSLEVQILDCKLRIAKLVGITASTQSDSIRSYAEKQLELKLAELGLLLALPKQPLVILKLPILELKRRIAGKGFVTQ